MLFNSPQDRIINDIEQKVQVQPHTRLTFRNMPGADFLTLGSAHADVRVDPDNAVGLREGRPEGAELRAGCVAAVHTAPGNVQLKFLPVIFPFGCLDEEPVVRGEAMVHLPFFRCGPVGNLDPAARQHVGHGAFRFREFMLIDLPAGVNTLPAGNTFTNVQEGTELRLTGGRSVCHSRQAGRYDGTGGEGAGL